MHSSEHFYYVCAVVFKAWKIQAIAAPEWCHVWLLYTNALYFITWENERICKSLSYNYVHDERRGEKIYISCQRLARLLTSPHDSSNK